MAGLSLGCNMFGKCHVAIYDRNLTGSTPFSKYQRQRIIQRVVRVPSSLYTMNVGALNVYQDPSGIAGSVENGNVNWNQMSDRVVAHTQFRGSAGRSQGGNSRRRTVTCLRPGALSPGGTGVDIKHNSYDRYLARLKGKAPLKQQSLIGTNFGSANVPTRGVNGGKGGKVIKMGLLANCTCGPDDKSIVAEGGYIDVEYKGPTVECACTEPVCTVINPNYNFDPTTKTFKFGIPYSYYFGADASGVVVNPVYGYTSNLSLPATCNYNADKYGSNVLYSNSQN